MGSRCTGVVHISNGDEQELAEAVALAGPITVAVDSRHTSFQVIILLAWFFCVVYGYCLL